MLYCREGRLSHLEGDWLCKYTLLFLLLPSALLLLLHPVPYFLSLAWHSWPFISDADFFPNAVGKTDCRTSTRSLWPAAAVTSSEGSRRFAEHNLSCLNLYWLSLTPLDPLQCFPASGFIFHLQLSLVKIGMCVESTWGWQILPQPFIVWTKCCVSFYVRDHKKSSPAWKRVTEGVCGRDLQHLSGSVSSDRPWGFIVSSSARVRTPQRKLLLLLQVASKQKELLINTASN